MSMKDHRRKEFEEFDREFARTRRAGIALTVLVLLIVCATAVLITYMILGATT